MTTLRNTQAAWGTIAKTFHWVVGLAAIVLLADGWWMTHLVGRDGRLTQYQLHSVIGYYLLLLIALRLLWRASNPVPALPGQLADWEKGAAIAAHWLLYLLMLAVSISGWLVSQSLSRPIEATLFGVIPVPNPLGASARELHETLEETNHVLSYTLLALIVLHAASALRHHFWKKNDVLRRMWWSS